MIREYTKEDFMRVKELIDIGIALSAEKDHRLLLERILTEARRVTNCDAGTLYFVEGDKLSFKIIQNETLGIFQGGHGEPIDLPPVEIKRTSISGLCALENLPVSISDVYASNQEYGLDFSGPQKYDALTGYHTQSMLAVPLENHDGEVIGVLQLINAKDHEGCIVPFAEYTQHVAVSLASQAAVALTNKRFVDELNELFHSFVEVTTTAIDERSPYNANHTRHIATMTKQFAEYLVKNGGDVFPKGYFDANHIDQLVMAAWLHDIGKVSIPLEIMDKPTRLGGRLDIVLNRIDRIAADKKVAVYESFMERGSLDGLKEAVDAVTKDMEEVRQLIIHMDDPSTFVDDELLERFEPIKTRTYLKGGEWVPYLDDYEIECLSIRRGTLTAEERHSIENHVVISRKMLNKIPFNKTYEHVNNWASSHHEFIDGTGYPNHLKGDELEKEMRILTIIDIFEALTAKDRPYKRAMPIDKAFFVLEDMAKAGKIDGDIVRLFKESQIWTWRA